MTPLDRIAACHDPKQMGTRKLATATYDESCWNLAVAFLVDHPEKNTPENQHMLATTIQRAIEDEIEFGLKPPRKNGDPCPSCNKPYFDGDTCSRGGCPLGGDF